MDPLSDTIRASLNIQKTLGTRRAAGFLRNRGVSLHFALLYLARRHLREI